MAGDVVNALVVEQWLPGWNEVHFDEQRYQAKPAPFFLMFTMPATTLRALSQTYRRDASMGVARADDTSIQRKHDESRSAEIKRFVQHGYPWSDLSATRRNSPESDDLFKPGWLPTAVVVNLLSPGDMRQGKEVSAQDAMHVDVPTARSGEVATVSMPARWNEEAEWEPEGAPPVEVIDGQHRLWAFDDVDDDLGYSLPVVAFYDLDISWQAYLFWTINIKPKRINASLAFDLYPLLREQDWLEAGEGIRVYRETRAQELTEALWSVPASPWFHRINMLGEGRRVEQPVTQSAFVKSLSESFVKPWRVGARIGGLFGNNAANEGLGWNRTQQSAFVVYLWQQLRSAVRQSTASWADNLRQLDDVAVGELEDEQRPDPAFVGQYSLLASDQGVRAMMLLINNVAVANAERLRLNGWQFPEMGDDLDPDMVELASLTCDDEPFAELLHHLAVALASYDLRTSKTPGLSGQERDNKLALRGSSGYTVLRERLETHVRQNGDAVTAAALSELDRLR